MKRINVLWVLLILFLILSFEAVAIGVTPASVEMDYVPGLSSEINFSIRPSSSKEIGATIGVSPSKISEFITLSKSKMDFTDESENREFTLNIDVPNNNNNIVGKQTARIIVSGLVERSNAMIGATAGIKIPIRIYFPYPGKYVDINGFKISSINEGEDTTASWSLQSRGSETVSVTQKVEFFDSNNELFFEKNLNPVVLIPGQIYSESLPLSVKNKPSGTYRGILLIEFDNKKRNRSNNFVIGTEDVLLLNYTPKELDYNIITEMRFILENKWNGEFKNVFGEINIAGKRTQTPTTLLEPLRGGSIFHYVDMKGVEAGNYTGTLKLHFDDNEKDFTFDVIVLTEEETQKRNGNYEEPTNYTFILIIIMIVLVVIAIIVYLLSLRNKKE